MKKNVIWIIIGLIAGIVIAATNAPNAQINSKPLIAPYWN